MILILNQSYISECLSYFLYVEKNEWLCCVIITWDLARPQTKASQIIFPLYKETLYVLKYVCMYYNGLFFFHRSKVWLLIQFRFSNTYVFKKISHFGTFDLKSYYIFSKWWMVDFVASLRILNFIWLHYYQM